MAEFYSETIVDASPSFLFRHGILSPERERTTSAVDSIPIRTP